MMGKLLLCLYSKKVLGVCSTGTIEINIFFFQDTEITNNQSVQ